MTVDDYVTMIHHDYSVKPGTESLAGSLQMFLSQMRLLGPPLKSVSYIRTQPYLLTSKYAIYIYIYKTCYNI